MPGLASTLAPPSDHAGREKLQPEVSLPSRPHTDASSPPPTGRMPVHAAAPLASAALPLPCWSKFRL